MPKQFPILAILLIVLNSCQKNHYDENPQPIDSVPGGNFGMIYYGTITGYFVGYDLSAEKEVWRVSPGSDYGTRPSSGVVGTDSGRIYLSSVYSLTCVNGTNGQVLWRNNFMTPAFQRGNTTLANYPVFADSMVYTISYGWSGHRLNALNKYTGQLLWAGEMGEGMDISGRYYGSPVIHKDKIYALCPRHISGNAKIQCYNRITGQLIWEVFDYKYALESNPIIVDNSLLAVFSTTNRYVTTYDLETGAQVSHTLFNGVQTFGNKIYSLRGKLYSEDYYSVKMMNIDYRAGEVSLKVDHRYSAAEFFDDLYVSDGYTITRRNAESLDSMWGWVTPYKRYMDSLWSAGVNVWSEYDWFFYKFYVSDKYVFTIDALRTKGYPGPLKYIYSSIFIIDKNTGKLIKEIKLELGGDNFINPYNKYWFSEPALSTSQYYP